MKPSILLLTLSTAWLVGCDYWASRRFDVQEQAGLSFTVDSPSTKALVEAIAAYAARQKMSCQSTDRLLLKCYRQPIYIDVYLTDSGATVCAHAVIAQFEAKGFGDPLLQELSGRFGSAVVSHRGVRCVLPQ
jgi:hypothetical protein